MALIWIIGSVVFNIIGTLISVLIVLIVGSSLKDKGKLNIKDFRILLILAFVFGWLFLIVYLFRNKRN